MSTAEEYTQPKNIENVEQLEDAMSTPFEGVMRTMDALQGDIIVLGAGGKMGPSLSRMAKRASDEAGVNRKVIGVSRFGSGNLIAEFQASGIETIRCDLLNQEELDALPYAPNVVFMAGMKFGSTGNESLTWAMNSWLPGLVCRKYKDSKIVVFSSGNVYRMTPPAYGGAVEGDELGPVGEYAMSVLGRERIFEHFSKTLGIPMAINRLTYATELRYGVLVDIARQVISGETIDLTMGSANIIWQGNANDMILRTFDHVSSPPFVINIAGPEILSIRQVAEQVGEMVGREVKFSGNESPDALLCNGQLGYRLFGRPSVSAQQLLKWIVDWIMRGGESLNKPTHYSTRDGRF